MGFTGAKLGAVVMTGLTLTYVFLLADKGLILLQQASPVAKAMGALVLFLPVLAIWMIIRELRFGLKVEAMAQLLEQAGGWPELSYETRPSGRPTKESAATVFEKIRTQTEANPEDWTNWFKLGLAYDASGDRPRARRSMRKALALKDAGSAQK